MCVLQTMYSGNHPRGLDRAWQSRLCSPITVDNLVPAVELQARISAWVAERKHGATTRPTSSDDTPSKKVTLSVTPVNVQVVMAYIVMALVVAYSI